MLLKSQQITSSFVKVGNKTFEETFMPFDTVDDANTANCSPA